MNYAAAKADCKARGAMLACPRNKDELTAIGNYLRSSTLLTDYNLLFQSYKLLFLMESALPFVKAKCIEHDRLVSILRWASVKQI